MTTGGDLVALLLVVVCIFGVGLALARLNGMHPANPHDPSSPQTFSCPRCGSPTEPGYMHGRGFAWSTSPNALQIFGLKILSRRAVITAWRCTQCAMVLVDTTN